MKSQVKVLVELRRVCDSRSWQYEYFKLKYLNSFQQVEASRSIAEIAAIQEQLRRLLLLLLLLLLPPPSPPSLLILTLLLLPLLLI